MSARQNIFMPFSVPCSYYSEHWCCPHDWEEQKTHTANIIKFHETFLRNLNILISLILKSVRKVLYLLHLFKEILYHYVILSICVSTNNIYALAVNRHIEILFDTVNRTHTFVFSYYHFKVGIRNLSVFQMHWFYMSGDWMCKWTNTFVPYTHLRKENYLPVREFALWILCFVWKYARLCTWNYCIQI
jgi:hypothetical protein